jgi:hypothetical protein
MSVRKGSIGGGGNGPRGEANKRASPVTNDAEYSAAIAVLNEANMAEACALLLSEKDYESHEQDESDHKKLLQLFEKCQAASKVVQKRAPAMMPPLQQQRGPANAARTQAIPLKPKVKAMIPPRRASVASRPSVKKTGPLPASHSIAPPPNRKLQREASDSSFASSGSIGSGRSAKKARVSPPTIDAQTGGGKAKAPPPSAMSFLAALNAGQGKERQEMKEKPAPKRESPTKARNTSPPPTAGSRKQPPRCSRKG